MSKTILQKECPFCHKIFKELGRDVFGKDVLILGECGHTLVVPVVESTEYDMVSSDGRRPFPFQIEGVKFLEAAGCNGLLLDEQGLGKTVQECLLLSRNQHLFPALIIVKSGLRAQWFAEIFRWTGRAAQVVTGSRELPLFEFFDIVIVSMDSLRLLRPDVEVVSEYDNAVRVKAGKKPKVNTPVWTDEICSHFKHICVDEGHKLKNPGSKRTMAFRKILAAANGGQKAPLVWMTGTNIEKNADEFFVSLNAVRPEMFYSHASFRLNYVDIDRETGRIGGLKNYEQFKERTKDFIIRRLRADVLPDLPKIFRQFRLAEMEGDELKAYIKIVKEFQEFMDEDGPHIPTDILGYLAKMRHITGIAKINAACEFVEEFLLEAGMSAYDYNGTEVNAPRKIVIFAHHKLAMDILMTRLETLCKEGGYAPPLLLSADLDAMTQRPALIEEFRKPENRIMIASTLASAEGLNLQFCSDCLIMERQWNPSTEEQAEARFPRPGSTAARVNAHYLIAAGTIDDFLTELVEQKRRNVAQALDGKEMTWDEKSLIGELSNALRTKGLKRWNLQGR
jgi:SNF2 family DNA or RNA helicase